MRRAFVDREATQGISPGARMALPEDAAHHLLRVLRLAPGAPVELFDGEGRVLSGRLEEAGQVLIERVGAAVPPLPPVVVAQAAVRAPKLEEVVRRSTELGASRVHVFQAERSNAPSVRLERLERVAREAARQCERAFVPSLTGPAPFRALVDEVGRFEGAAVLGVIGAELPLSRVLAGGRFRERGLFVVVGPEGGLTGDEQRALTDAGAQPVSLGVHVLRTETASLAALACAQVAAGVL